MKQIVQISNDVAGQRICGFIEHIFLWTTGENELIFFTARLTIEHDVTKRKWQVLEVIQQQYCIKIQLHNTPVAIDLSNQFARVGFIQKINEARDSKMNPFV